MTTPTDTGERGGATSVQMAILWIAMITFILAVVQTALLYLAGQLALTAAEDGLRSGRYYGVGSAEQARRSAQDFLARTAGDAKGTRLSSIARAVRDIARAWVAWGWRFRWRAPRQGDRIARVDEPFDLDEEVLHLVVPLMREYR